MSRCNLLITNDSGPMHVAISQQVPIVALYGPSNPFFYGPYQAHAIVLETMNSYEIGKSMKKIIKEGNYKGLSVISEEQVIKAAETFAFRIEIKHMNYIVFDLEWNQPYSNDIQLYETHKNATNWGNHSNRSGKTE